MKKLPSPEEFEVIKREAAELSEALGIEVKRSSSGDPLFHRKVLHIVFKNHGFTQEPSN